MVEQLMTLDEVLATLKKHGVASAEVIVNGAPLRVVFDTMPAELPGTAPTPGGWKSESPSRLDHPGQFEVHEVP